MGDGPLLGGQPYNVQPYPLTDRDKQILREEAENKVAADTYQSVLRTARKRVPSLPTPEPTPVFGDEEAFNSAAQEASTLADPTPVSAFTPYRPGFKSRDTLRDALSRRSSPVLRGAPKHSGEFDFDTYSQRVVQRESSGRARAKNPRSSATGLHQFTEGTWQEIIDRYHPELNQGRSRDQILSLRKDPEISNQVFQSLTEENRRVLARKGVPIRHDTLYAAHFAGPSTAAALYNADDNVPVSRYFNSAELKANPHLRGMTVGEFKQWAAKSMGN